MSLEKAYLSAGYEVSGPSARRAAKRLAKRPGIIERVQAIRDVQARIRAEATKLAIERSAINKERVAVELGRIGFSNMMDYMRVGPSGDPVLDFSKLTREQAAALTEVTVDDYLDGRGEDAREVRKVQFKLGDKRAALMDIAKLFGWIVERRENRVVDEFENMSDADLEAWLDERAEARLKVRQRTRGKFYPRGRRDRDWNPDRAPLGGIGRADVVPLKRPS